MFMRFFFQLLTRMGSENMFQNMFSRLLSFLFNTAEQLLFMQPTNSIITVYGS